MSFDPYRTPRSEPRDPGHARRRPVLGVLVGFVVDVGGTTVIAILAGIAFALFAASQGQDPDQSMYALLDSDPFTPLNVALTAVGLFMSWAGGWVCTRVARARSLWPGVALACLIGVFNLRFTDDTYALGMFAALMVAGFAATMFGAWSALDRRADGDA